MSQKIPSKETPVLRKIENIISKFIRPSRKIRPITSHSKLQSEYQFIVPNNNCIDTLNRELSTNLSVTSKPKKNSINYHVHMKCLMHELRTPISTITLGLNLLKSNIKDNDNLQTIRDIKKSAIFIENILTKFAIVEDGNIELNVFEPFSLQKLIANVEILILYNFKESDVLFTYNIEPTVTLWNYGDAHNIKHVLINLLKNAIKYRTIDRINTVSIHVSGLPYIDKDEQQTVYISVKDNNNHLLPHIKEHLFEPFNSTSESGMGLYICKTIVELHGGTIMHNFIKPIGNDFIITLHLTLCRNLSLHLHTPVSNASSYKIPSNNSSSKTTYNILLVDDSMLNRKMMYKVLKTVPIFTHIYTAEDGTDALNKIKNHLGEFSLVLLDKNMPIMDGWESVKHMRTLSYDKLVIGLTGEDSPEEINGFINSGADYVIVKPLDNEKLQRIHRFLIKYGSDRPSNKTIQMVNDQLEWV